MNETWNEVKGWCQRTWGHPLRGVVAGLLGAILTVYGLATEPRDPYSWTRQNSLVAHANGSANGVPATNSREAFVQSYARGLRVFEMDLNLTSDHQLVGVHDWSPATLAGLGLNLPPGKPLPPTYATFKRQKIHGKFTILGLPDVLHLLSQHRDAFLITDTKVPKGPDVTEAFTLIVKACKRTDPRLLERIIPQIYNQPMLETIRSVYPFQSIIYTLYNSRDKDPQVVEFVKRTGIRVVVMPTWRATPEFLKALNDCGVITFVHTINNREELDALKRIGVHGIYSDQLGPKDLQNHP